ncbi:MAG TPA: c-type cytochrome [Usitatibacter sp.]|nr:c-type cytochrome [Usitatibacter sp.]
MSVRGAPICAALAAWAGLALAQQPDFAPPNLSAAGARDMAANCAACHGTDGRAAAGSGMSSLAGRADVARLLRAFRDGKRESTVMRQIARGYGDAEIDAIGAYFARRPDGR